MTIKTHIPNFITSLNILCGTLAVAAGCGFQIHNETTFVNELKTLLASPEKLQDCRRKSRDFITSNAGATGVIMKELINKLKYHV